MAKQVKKNVYDYIQTQMPSDAIEGMNKLYPEMVDLTGLSKHQIKRADVWVAALTKFMWMSNEDQLKALRDIGVDC